MDGFMRGACDDNCSFLCVGEYLVALCQNKAIPRAR